MKKNEEIKREYICNDIHLREEEGDKERRTIAGYAIMFNQLSAPLWEDENGSSREIIAPSAITRELLDKSDIKMTMFHDRQLILARSNKGEGTLRYNIDDKGVAFEFDAPHTADGDKAIELVKRGDIAGCSFAFSTYYFDSAYVDKKVEFVDKKREVTYTVNKVTGIYDFTLAADPAYPSTSVEAREFVESLKENKKFNREQIADMRRTANIKIFEV